MENSASISTHSEQTTSPDDDAQPMDTDAANHQQPDESQSEEPPVIATGGQQLIDFLQYLEDYKPTVPDSVTQHIMHSSGFHTTDPRILRLASLASQKFIADIANDALQHCKMRTAISQNKKAPKDKRHTLTFEDIVPVLTEYGINIKKPQYFF